MDVGGVEILGLATTVGGVPFTEVEPAVEFALRAHERFPTVPVLHRSDRSLVALGLLGVEGVGGFDVDDGPTVDVSRFDPVTAGSLERLLEVAPTALDPLDRVLLGAGEGVAAVRVGVLGPVTLALTLRAAGLDLDAAVRGAVTVVTDRTTALVERAHGLRPGCAVVAVLVEPGLVGSVHPTFPLGRDVVRGHLLAPVVDALGASPVGRGLVGVHVPGRTDWEAVVGTGASFVSLPAQPEVASWAPAIGRLVAAGGVLAWGAVPVNRPLGLQADSLWRSLSATFAALAAEGVDPVELRLRSLVGPVDGLEGFDVPGAGRVVDLCTDLSSRLRRQSLATRLSLGA